MKIKSIISITAVSLGLLFAVFLPGTASALSLDYGKSVVAIDGDADTNVTVNIVSLGFTSPYVYGYFLNNSTTFTPLAPISIKTFQGGDVIDFALYYGSKYYTLSGDYDDDSYSVAMGFATEITNGSAQQPADWTEPYYHNVNITWTLPQTVNTNEWALNFRNRNDGVAPVPEPSTLLMLGSGLVGLAFLLRKKRLTASR